MKSNRVNDLIDKGDEYLSQGNLDAAEECYQRALDLDSESVEGLYSIGCVYSHRHEFATASEWARKALALNEDHAPSRALLGNCLLGLEQFAEAKRELTKAYADEPPPEVLGQIGLCHEALGEYEEAETILRKALENDLSYGSRHLFVAMHSSQPLFADLHHALARVLQRQGNVEEAKLHYHLTKRIDATTELDPMFREIMTDADLEDHPMFDQSPDVPQDGTGRLAWIINELEDYDSFRAALDPLDPEQEIPRIVGLMQASQSTGEFYLSAKLRAAGDELYGKSARELFEALNARSWKRFFELVGRVYKGELREEETLLELERLELNWESAELLLDLTSRFIELDVNSGLTLADLVSKLLALSPRAEHKPASQIMLGKALGRARMWGKAEKALNRAYEAASQRGLAVLELEALAALASHYMERGRLDEALNKVNAYIDVAEKANRERNVVWARLTRSSLLAQVGQAEEALTECLNLLPKWEVADTIGQPGEFRSLVEWIAREAGREIPPDLLSDLSMAGEESPSPEALIDQAEALLAEEQWDEAVSLLEQAEAMGRQDGDRPVAAKALYVKGVVLAAQDKLEEAAEALAQSLATAKPRAASIDLWPIFMQSAHIASKREQLEEAQEFLESALAKARANKDREQEIMTLRTLSALLEEIDPDRALALLEEIPEEGTRRGELPEAWLEAEQAFESGAFVRAVQAYERLLSQTGPQIDELRPFAIANMAEASVQLGRVDEALAGLQQAASLFEAAGDTERAIECMARSGLLLHQVGESPVDTMQAAVEYAQGQENPDIRRKSLMIAGSAAFDTDMYDHAEIALSEALEIAVSKEGRDVRDELETRETLARLWRHRGRYAEALQQYKSAIKCAQFLGDKTFEAGIRGNMGITLRYLGRLDEAVDQFKQAIEYGDREELPILAATHRTNLAISLFLLGRRAQAVQSILEALDEFDSRQEIQDAERCLAILGMYNSMEEVPQEIRTRIERLAVDGIDSQEPIVRAWAESGRAEYMFAEGDKRGAKRILMDVAARFARSGDRYNQTCALLSWAELILDEDPNEAKQTALEARKLAESLEYVDLLARCTKVLLLCAAHLEDEPNMEIQLDMLLEEWRQVRRALSDDRDRVRLADDAAEFLDILAEYYLANGRSDRALELQDLGRSQALLDFEYGPEEPTFNVRGMQELLARVPRAAVLLSIGWEDDSLVTLTLTQEDDQPEVCRTGITRRHIAKLLETYEREILLFRGEGASSWERQAAPLLTGAFSRIPQDGTVFLSLEEELQSVPIHAISLPDGKPLLQRAAVVYVPSMRLLARMATNKEKLRKGVHDMVCAGVTFQDETLAITQRFGALAITGNDLTAKEQLAFTFKLARIIHIACHGYFDPDNHLESGLVLRNTDEMLARDVLSVRELLNWRLKADLAVLSACQTGRGRASASDFLGLGRAFLATGVRSVVTALWDVETMATQRLMLDFYRHLFRSFNDGLLDAAEALRQAQLNAALQASFCDWAAFKLTGWPYIETETEEEKTVGTRQAGSS